METTMAGPADGCRSAIEMMNPHPILVRNLIFVCGLGSLACNSGCEQRYVGGPVAIVKGKPPEHGMLGVTFSDPPNILVLSDVLTEGPAFQAGIQIGDEILALNQQEVKTVDDLRSIVRSTHPGDEVVVRVRRSGSETDFNVTLCDFGLIMALRSLEDPPGQLADAIVDEPESAEQ